MDMMIEKQKVNSKLHQLRIIQIFEDDYNFFLKKIFGDRLMSFAIKHYGLNGSQHRPKHGNLCQSSILNKILTYDILRVTKNKGGYAEFDITIHYDRMVPALVVLACAILGLGPVPINMLFDLLKNLAHKIRTAYGDSSVEYVATPMQHLFGIG